MCKSDDDGSSNTNNDQENTFNHEEIMDLERNIIRQNNQNNNRPIIENESNII